MTTPIRPAPKLVCAAGGPKFHSGQRVWWAAGGKPVIADVLDWGADGTDLYTIKYEPYAGAPYGAWRVVENVREAVLSRF